MVVNIDVNNFDALKIGLASPEKIRSWSNGEVKKPETINYRTLKPEKDGLFCERIFGPTKDWECYCGKYKRVRFKGIICERCGVEVTRSNVRRERMGHIELASPVSHIWFFKGVPSRMGYILDISPKDLEKVLYFDSYIITSINREKINTEGEEIKKLSQKAAEKAKELHESRLKEIELNKDNFMIENYEVNDKSDLIEGGEEDEKTGENLDEVISSNVKSEENPELNLEERKIKVIKETEMLLEEEKEMFKEEIDLIKRADTFFFNLEEKMLVSDEALFKKMKEIYGQYFKGGMGAEAIKELLKNIDCKKEVEELKEIIKKSKGQKRSRGIKRLKIISSFIDSENKPEFIVLDMLPVIPPDLRPMVQLDGGRFATSDLNDLYRRVINRNNRLKKLLELDAPEIIINNEKRMLQEAVDALFDNGRRGRAVVGAGNRPLKSLSDMLKGKQGRFRQNLLGKRVDYSGRSVIVVNPNLELSQCGLPKKMALELFKPFVMKKLVDEGLAQNIKSAKTMVEKESNEVWDVLEEVIKKHPVLLNRAPTLHRLGIQAFMPVLVEGKAIQIHPMVCPAFNADFDGDQMAVHVPLSNEAKAEAMILMLSVNNILSPANGEPVVVPSQDMILGIYYLTSEREKSGGKERFYRDMQDAILAYDYGLITLHTPIKVKIEDRILRTTAGRIIFNQSLPGEYKFVNKEISKKELISIISECIGRFTQSVVTEMLDSIKQAGFKYSTRSGLTIGMEDIDVPAEKVKILSNIEKKIEKIEDYYKQGLITEFERRQRVIQAWSQANESVANAMEKNFDRFNPVYMMATSGARGNIKQLRQLAGMRGLVANARGDIIDSPIKSNFREGLTVLEYFISTHGARQGLADTALRTADSGYLTRRLVDVAQDTMVRINDCKTEDGISLYVLTLEGEPNTNLIGRICLEDVDNPNTKKEIIISGEEITEKHLQKFILANIESIKVRSVMTCQAESGICQKCYGRDLASGKIVEIGEAVGIIAAQSIGEPGTQLTMRTFHTGGVASTVIQRSIKSPVKGKLMFKKELLSELNIKKTDFTEDDTSEVIEINIEHIPHKLIFQIQMERGDIVDVIIPKGEILQINKKINVDVGEVFAKLILTAKRKTHVHKHEKTFEGIDITSGLPRVVELFEARKPKEHSFIAEISGKIEIEDIDSRFRMLTIKSKDGKQEKVCQIPTRARLNVENGDTISAGSQLTEGPRNPHDILRINGIKECEQYLVKEVQNVYKAQGVDINDKHIEVIARQMLKKVTIIDPGDSNFLPGQLVDRLYYEKENNRLISNMKKPATAVQNLMGITKASLVTDSFLSAASFQETTRVLTDAAIENKVDYLNGLKENVILGKAIPAGTGMGSFRDYELEYPGYKENNKDEIEILQESGGDDTEEIEINI
ncbi:MAG: DNA-directed RNA polymerase subunit beta' [Actinobacteria bacterium RBG_19FT_COMBO_36_27]|nr:MAG: DNA-directed RNA polymerase subunit beta' [Actinobacteria bacterium RBG_19FT_COMBO_36_27]